MILGFFRLFINECGYFFPSLRDKTVTFLKDYFFNLNIKVRTVINSVCVRARARVYVCVCVCVCEWVGGWVGARACI
jgi:hypothetical protein